MSISIEDLQVDKVTSTVYHIEQRPSECGRHVVIATASGNEVIGKEWDAWSSLHEHKCTPTLVHDGLLYFSHFGDNRIYKATVEGGEPIPVTPDNRNHHFANFAVHPGHSDWLASTLEDYTNEAKRISETTLVLVDTKNCTVAQFAKGADLYSQPQFSPDGKMLAWIQEYPADRSCCGSELIVADCSLSPTGLTISNMRHIAGQRRHISVNEPTWISNTIILFTSDEDGYFNLWGCAFTSSLDPYVIGPIVPRPIFKDLREPAWTIGWTNYAMLDGRRAIFMAHRRAQAQLYLVDVVKQMYLKITTPYAVIRFLRSAGKGRVVFFGRKLDDEGHIVELTLGPDTHPVYTPIRYQQKPRV